MQQKEISSVYETSNSTLGCMEVRTSHATSMNHTHEWVIPHTHMNESYHTHTKHTCGKSRFKWNSSTFKSHCAHTAPNAASSPFICVNESCHTYRWVTIFTYRSHLGTSSPVVHMNESCRTWMSHVTHVQESCHAWHCIKHCILACRTCRCVSRVTHLSRISN